MTKKPEVRKAGGVYYTPQYIVDYIVKNTVGKLCEDKSPRQIEKLRILDPACGSGSFLLGAFQYLIEYHRNYYENEVNEKGFQKRHQQLVYQGRGGQWLLTTAEKKRILLNNIYGVDIDSQAMEVTKLSLLLKVLEDENQDTLERQLRLWRERALPDLGNNIKCGNSLIGSDFYEQKQMSFLEEEERYRINAFDWETEFPHIFGGTGGFDAVIGNPPYGAEFSKIIRSYLKERYNTFVWRGESYLIFIERAFQLLKLKGMFGYIVPDTYLNLGFTQALRNYLLQNSKIYEVVLLPLNVFEGTTVDTTLLFAEKTQFKKGYHDVSIDIKVFNKKTIIRDIEEPDRKFRIDSYLWYEQESFNLQANKDEILLINKIKKNNITLESIAEIYYGIKGYQVGKGKPPQTKEIRDKKPFTGELPKDKSWLPFYDGRHIGRYVILWESNNWINYGEWLAEPRNPEIFREEKILIRKIVSKTIIATYVKDTSYCNTLLFVLKLTDLTYPYLYILGILNSTLIGWHYRKKFQISEEDTFPQILIRDVLQFPIPNPNKTQRERMVKLVDTILSLNSQLQKASLPDQKENLQRQIITTDKQIDKLVYELYGLNEGEIRIIEESTTN